jgi:hypothetical protein
MSNIESTTTKPTKKASPPKKVKDVAPVPQTEPKATPPKAEPKVSPPKAETKADGKAAPKSPKITLLAKECPSKKGTNRAKRWSKLENGMTVAEAREEGVPSSYLNRMADAGHLKIG